MESYPNQHMHFMPQGINHQQAFHLQQQQQQQQYLSALAPHSLFPQQLQGGGVQQPIPVQQQYQQSLQSNQAVHPGFVLQQQQTQSLIPLVPNNVPQNQSTGII